MVHSSRVRYETITKSTNVNVSVQPKLEIGQPGDKYEREADAVADKVMMMPNHGADQMQLKPNSKEPMVNLKCSNCQKGETIQMKPAIQMKKQKPCPEKLKAKEPVPKGWKAYQGDSSWFHCGYRGILENRKPTADDPQNECFYDETGSLVDSNHAYAKCGGTPNQYDSKSNPFEHALIDSGGIVEKGWDAFVESRRHDLETFPPYMALKFLYDSGLWLYDFGSDMYELGSDISDIASDVSDGINDAIETGEDLYDTGKMLYDGLNDFSKMLDNIP